MLILGLTGRSGSGKGYLSDVFARYGICSIDCDRVSRDVCAPNSPCVKELADTFGQDIIDQNGVLQRKKLAQIAFADAKSTKKLNAITHPYILQALEAEIETCRIHGAKAVLLDAPTLFESGLNQRCDAIICVTSTDEARVERIVKRDEMTKEDALARLARQKSDAEFRRLCDYEIVNDGAKDCEAQVKIIIEQLNLR